MGQVSKVALVSGGTKGLGRAISLRLSELGFDVFALFGHDHDAAQTLKIEAEKRNLCIKPVKVDLTDPVAIDLFFKDNQDLRNLDVLINNASPNFTAEKFQKWSLEKFDELFSVNVRAPFQMMQSSFPLMKAKGGGKIVNILSSYTLSPAVTGTSGYAAAKLALWGITQAAAAEYKRFNIFVNAISPGTMDCGVVRTWPETLRELVRDQMPKKRFIPLEDVTSVVESLILEKIPRQTGTNFPVLDTAL